jgi:hypothetical protein
MSANRSVQAAQRRRAGTSNSESGIPGRGPQPSINSAQMFANQARPGQGPNMPTGRLAGQQAALQQKQQQQNKYVNLEQEQHNDKLSSVSKMTVPQAITLITLRLGALESKMMNSGSISIDGESGIDPGFLQSIMERLETIENRPVLSGAGSNSNDLTLIKQQFETVKQAVVQIKGSTVNLVKENTSLKTQIENLKKEFIETKELLATLQNITMDNSQKILDLTIGTYTGEFNETGFEENDNFTDLNDLQGLQELEYNSEQNEIIGTDLKQLIESELNTNI